MSSFPKDIRQPPEGTQLRRECLKLHAMGDSQEPRRFLGCADATTWEEHLVWARTEVVKDWPILRPLRDRVAREKAAERLALDTMRAKLRLAQMDRGPDYLEPLAVLVCYRVYLDFGGRGSHNPDKIDAHPVACFSAAEELNVSMNDIDALVREIEARLAAGVLAEAYNRQPPQRAALVSTCISAIDTLTFGRFQERFAKEEAEKRSGS